ncbi:hypothetical protein [Paenibacillus ihuae]|uniref:hypothetical protein n=1 Tax=Paenibacillus ihuae TaxID=1232431 RepID=UPI0006D58E6E|nr:hypothetical protein [Paenibacillus ihuae]
MFVEFLIGRMMHPINYHFQYTLYYYELAWQIMSKKGGDEKHRLLSMMSVSLEKAWYVQDVCWLNLKPIFIAR